jgi:hydrogenase-4 membrane subunit HyfE
VSSLLVAYLGVLCVPLLAGSWRVSLLGLAAQGFVLGAIALQSPFESLPAAGLLLADLFLVRGLFVPRLLYGIQRAQQAPSRNDVIPPNIFFWAVGATLVFLGFQFARQVATAERELHVAVAVSGVLLALLVLASGRSTFSQIIGVLRLENAIALLELGFAHRVPIAMHAALLGVFLLTVGVFGSFLRRGALEVVGADPDEGPTL